MLPPSVPICFRSVRVWGGSMNVCPGGISLTHHPCTLQTVRWPANRWHWLSLMVWWLGPSSYLRPKSSVPHCQWGSAVLYLFQPCKSKNWRKKKKKNKKENISPLACSCLTNVLSPLYSIPVKYKQLFCQEMSIFLNYQPVGNQITIVRGNNEQALMSKKPTNEVINLLLYDNDYALACLMASM